MHSPHVFQLITTVFNDRTVYPEYLLVERMRNQLKRDQRSIPVMDLGAGSTTRQADQRRIASIARHAAKSPKLGQLLFRLARFYQPTQMLELGTSLGISSYYLQSGQPAASLTTIEGSPAVAGIARENFQRHSLDRIDLRTGNFDEQLPLVLQQMERVDLAFIDGNHREEPTVRYFHQLLEKTGPDSLLIFDDIHWSPEMERAWEQIIKHPAVRCSIDLFHIGIVLFRKEFLEKVSFRVRF